MRSYEEVARDMPNDRLIDELRALDEKQIVTGGLISRGIKYACILEAARRLEQLSPNEPGEKS